MTKTLQQIEQIKDRTATSRCDEGFIPVRWLVLQNLYSDGETSRASNCDMGVALTFAPGFL